MVWHPEVKLCEFYTDNLKCDQMCSKTALTLEKVKIILYAGETNTISLCVHLIFLYPKNVMLLELGFSGIFFKP